MGGDFVVYISVVRVGVPTRVDERRVRDIYGGWPQGFIAEEPPFHCCVRLECGVEGLSSNEGVAMTGPLKRVDGIASWQDLTHSHGSGLVVHRPYLEPVILSLKTNVASVWLKQTCRDVGDQMPSRNSLEL